MWGLDGAAALPRAWTRRVALIVLLASAGLIARAAAAPVEAGLWAKFDAGVYGWAMAFEALGVVAAAWTWQGRARRGTRASAIAAVTGVHTIGLWLATGQRLFLGVALGLSAAGLIGLGWPRAEVGSEVNTDTRLAISGLGSALVLWAACVSSLV